MTEKVGSAIGLSPEFSRALSRVRVAERDKAQGRPCPALRADEVWCEEGYHPLQGERRTHGRICRLAEYRAERRRLAAQLALCGYRQDADEIIQPVHWELWRLIDQTRAVDGLSDELDKIRAVQDLGWPASGHVAMIGDPGTVKTHALLMLYFAALWDGVSALWLTTSDLREVAKDLDSHQERISVDAQARISGWQKRKLLFLDDLGDRITDLRGAREPGSTKVASLLLDLFNGHAGRRFWASNLNNQGLAAHPDFGVRVHSRLFADHRGAPCTIVTLYGKDQRMHALRGSAK